jgi:hypothetical protein
VRFLRYWPVLVLTAVLIASSLYLLDRETRGKNCERHGSSPSGDASTGFQEVLGALAQIQERLHAVELSQALLEAQLRSPPSGSASVPAAPLPVRTPPGAVQDRAAEFEIEIRRRLSIETRDTVWASKAEADIVEAAQAAVGRDGVEPKLSVRCLSSLCKVEATFPSSAGPLGGLGTFPLLAGKGMAGFRAEPIVDGPDGTRTMSFEVFRQGSWTNYSGVEKSDGL